MQINIAHSFSLGKGNASVLYTLANGQFPNTVRYLLTLLLYQVPSLPLRLGNTSASIVRGCICNIRISS